MKIMRSLIGLIAVGAIAAYGWFAIAAASSEPDRTVLAPGRAGPEGVHDPRCAGRDAASLLHGHCARECTQRTADPDRRPRVRRHKCVWRTRSDAKLRPRGAGGGILHQFPHPGDLLADPRLDAERAQSSCREHGRHCGSGHCVSGQHDPHSARNGIHRRNPEAERLQYGSLRQMAPDTALGNKRVRAFRPLAHRPGL